MAPKLIVFASGTAEGGSSSTTPLGFSKTMHRQENLGGGSGFENLVKSPDLKADIVAVVSNHEHGGVRARAERLNVPFVHFPAPWDAEHYASVLQKTAIGNGWVALSGWFKFVHGLNPAKTFNVHPALLSFDNGRFGGRAMFGPRMHEAVREAFERGEITESGCTMHFVTDEYDRGPAFFEYRVPLSKGMVPDDIAQAVNNVKHEWQPRITNMVVHGEISWDGKNPQTLKVPAGYEYFPKL
ncbi:MAG: formyltransferase family protein [Patescibacteria group bacterium]